MPAIVSSLALLFSSWMIASAYPRCGRPGKLVARTLAGIERVSALASSTQAGKLSGSAVRQIRIRPFVERTLSTATSSRVTGAAAASAAQASVSPASVCRFARGECRRPGMRAREIAKPPVGAAEPIPEPEI